MDDHRVDEGGKDDGVDHVRVEGNALGHGSRHDRRRGGSEGPLEQPRGICFPVREIAIGIFEGGALEGEGVGADEAP